jgi:hypothetical protein
VPPVRQVTQTILYQSGEDQPVPGNCLQAAVASLLDRGLDQVPHFITRPDWLQYLVDWGREQGYLVIGRPPETVRAGIAYGPSPRGARHAVVYSDGRTVWDPHPSRAGLVSISGVIAWEPLGEEADGD